MHQMVMLILDDIDHCGAVFDAWEALGVSGITIFESTGLGRVRQMLGGLRDDLPMMPSLKSILQTREEHHRTLITVTDDEALVDKLIDAVYDIVGDLAQPNKGVIFVLPVLRIEGVVPREHWQQGKGDA